MPQPHYQKRMNLNGDQVDVFADTKTLAMAAARRFASLATHAVDNHGVFAVALSGGSTPQNPLRVDGNR